MKKLLILLASFSLAAGAAQAQSTDLASPQVQRRGGEGRQPRTPEQLADTRAQHLTKQLGLNADQTAKVRALALTQAQEAQSRRTTQQADRKAMGDKMRANHERYDAQLKDILTADQYAQYSKEREARKDNMRKGPRGNAPKAKS